MTENCCYNYCSCKRHCFSEITNKTFAQYGINSNPTSAPFIPYFELFSNGSLISLASNDTISLQRGYIYLIAYTILASPGDGNYFQIVPYINSSPRLLYGTFASANNSPNASISSTFITNEALENPASIQLRITYQKQTTNIDLSGTISIVPIATI